MLNHMHKPGNTLDWVNGTGSAKSAGYWADVATANVGFVGVLQEDTPDTETGELVLTGIFEVTKNSGETWVPGEPLYLSEASQDFSNVATGRTPAGYAAYDAASGDANGFILLAPGISI